MIIPYINLMYRAITAAHIVIIHAAQFKVALTEALFVTFVKLAKMSTYIVARNQINSKFRIFILRNTLNVAMCAVGHHHNSCYQVLL